MHFIGVAFGVGAATVTDLIALRFFLAGNIKEEHAAIIEFAAKIVTWGLAVLWISGLAFLMQYAAFDQQKLQNPKILAKITIVGVLTINGYFIHKVVLPLIRARVGRPLLHDLPPSERIRLLMFGTISVTSWYVPLVLGAVPQLNFVVPAKVILALYAATICMAVLAAEGVARITLQARVLPRSGWRWVYRPATLAGAAFGHVVLFGAVYWAMAPVPSTRPPLSAELLLAHAARVTEIASPIAASAPAFPSLAPDGATATGERQLAELPSHAGRAITPPPEGRASFEIGANEARSAVETLQSRLASVPVSDRVRGTQRNLSDSQDVHAVQQRLASLGFLSTPATGLWGERSREALRAFKSAHHLVPDDHFDEPTERLLFAPDTKPVAAFAGIWHADKAACSFSRHQASFLSTVINERGAVAGDVSCAFERERFDGKAWVVAATCSVPESAGPQMSGWRSLAIG